jgi:hypothetical protein
VVLYETEPSKTFLALNSVKVVPWNNAQGISMSNRAFSAGELALGFLSFFYSKLSKMTS